MLFITGTGRCGTSVVAQLCQQLGHNPGGQIYQGLWAGMEDSQLVGVNALLHQGQRQGQTREAQVERLHQALEHGLDRPVLKDPRLLLWPGLVEVWAQAVPGLRILWCRRDHGAVARSMLRHWAWFCWLGLARSEEAIAAELDRLSADFEGRLHLFSLPYRELHFPAFVDDPQGSEQVLEALRWGGLDFDQAKAQECWRRLADPNKVRCGG
jgi:hypothetical protein